MDKLPPSPTAALCRSCVFFLAVAVIGAALPSRSSAQVTLISNQVLEASGTINGNMNVSSITANFASGTILRATGP